MMAIIMMVCHMQEAVEDMPTEILWEDMPASPDTWKMTAILKEDDKRGYRAMRENLIIALEASWELDPELMEDVLWEKIDEIGVDSSESVYI